MTPLLFATAIGAALVAGIFCAFSTFVMQALGRLVPSKGIAAMQSINVAVINPMFFAVFFGTGVLCVATVGVALLPATEVSLIPTVAGGLLYLVGCIGVTMFGNVPLNERLATVNPDDAEAAPLWSLYLARWSLWNHVRTVASLAAAAVFLIATGTA